MGLDELITILTQYKDVLGDGEKQVVCIPADGKDYYIQDTHYVYGEGVVLEIREKE